MASSGKRKTTMAKLNRERRLRERRSEKEARKAQRKEASAARREFGDLVPGEPGDVLPGDFTPYPDESDDGDLPPESEDQPPPGA